MILKKRKRYNYNTESNASWALIIKRIIIIRHHQYCRHSFAYKISKLVTMDLNKKLILIILAFYISFADHFIFSIEKFIKCVYLHKSVTNTVLHINHLFLFQIVLFSFMRQFNVYLRHTLNW